MWWLLACSAPVEVERLVVDMVSGAPRADVVLRFEADGDCTREAATNDEGWLRATLCDAPYSVVPVDPTLAMTTKVEGPADALSPTPWSVRDVATGPALVGHGVELLSVEVDVRWVDIGDDGGRLPIPAVLPVALPTWGRTNRKGLFLPDALHTLQAVPVLPTDVLELEEGGPLQPWYALGVRVTEEGPTQVPPTSPATARAVPGGTLWTGLPAGTYALWDGQAPRVPLVRVE